MADDELRFQRIEDKVDDLKTDVIEIKVNMGHHMDRVEEHITGDKKIINEISPLLQKLPGLVEIVEDHYYTKRKKQERKDIIKSLSMKLGVVSVSIGILIGFLKLLALG